MWVTIANTDKVITACYVPAYFTAASTAADWFSEPSVPLTLPLTGCQDALCSFTKSWHELSFSLWKQFQINFTEMISVSVSVRPPRAHYELDWSGKQQMLLILQRFFTAASRRFENVGRLWRSSVEQRHQTVAAFSERAWRASHICITWTFLEKFWTGAGAAVLLIWFWRHQRQTAEATTRPLSHNHERGDRETYELHVKKSHLSKVLILQKNVKFHKIQLNFAIKVVIW